MRHLGHDEYEWWWAYMGIQVHEEWKEDDQKVDYGRYGEVDDNIAFRHFDSFIASSKATRS